MSAKKIVILAAILSIPLLYLGYQNLVSGTQTSRVAESALAEEPDRRVVVPINDGDTIGSITDALTIPYETVQEIIATSTPVYDLTSIRAGKEIVFYFDHDADELTKVEYEPGTENIVTVTRVDGVWHAEKIPIAYEIKQRMVSGTIESSLYETALEQDLDTRAIIDLAETFAWQIDFAVDIRKGDSFTMLYEERYRDGEYAMPGRIIAAKFNNAGNEYKGYLYEVGGEERYFDPEGNSLQKIFLKSPLQYRYISSGFTGARIDPISGHTAPHRAVDYAAAYGTPVVSVGDGTVVRAGWNGGYGYSVDVRHNETYTTRYGHFSKIAVKNGAQISQGDIVGYVGSTGHSTGPHLHYEIHKFGTPINPLTIELPPDDSLPSEILPDFQAYSAQFDI
ncbi:MAG: peptidoglycan DD-metalloendopeptidase family protein [Patescibacteria group bacterium]